MHKYTYYTFDSIPEHDMELAPKTKQILTHKMKYPVYLYTHTCMYMYVECRFLMSRISKVVRVQNSVYSGKSLGTRLEKTHLE